MLTQQFYNELVSLLGGVKSLGHENIRLAQQLKSSAIPNSIFKYRSGVFDKDGVCWDFENLKNNKLRMTLPENFNDPYDSAFSVATQVNGEVEGRLLDEFILKPIRRHLRVCCFSEVVDSMLMWTHYANEHKGFAIEYIPSQKASIPLNLWPVYYREDLFNMSSYLDRIGAGNVLLLPALHKSPDWAYEKEWRLVLPGHEGESVGMPIAKAIYLGARINSCLKKLLLEYASAKHIKIFEMRNSRSEFRMEACLIS